ncbi:MAG: prolipoprotein diacylglyceryl transferase [Candidatus Dormibacteraeota bacterium]|uniref:Phosphatidylglycerol--prolipoprotein diacylglyceryl transferase n=1 Tax=Candidatus Aeolococcus gillhamiae TaxID=3127015 RepID=A0A2W5YZX4_9BACT|nr:prolipoprotein diacylglyceryl transferase [Candidatus Dormibacteraeota bacterium]PZR78543.1 MAG: prolipoprotein diacylglyceryl transferase [Candidatus Dormibacter sp. RRmetagenome_bin12]
MVVAALHSAFATIRIDIDPVIHIGSLAVHWYGVMYAVAFLVAFRYGVLPHVVPRGVSRGAAERALVWTIIFGLLGGRLYYVLQQPDLVNAYLRNPIRIIAVWEGGMAFFGAIIAGLACAGIFAWRNRISVWLMWDAAVIFAVIGQPLGRIGNVINGDILGARSNLPWATGYANPHAVLQSGFHLVDYQPGAPWYYQPAAIYEALGTIVIGVILFAMRRRGVRNGALAVAYIPLYAISQLILFQFRASEPVIGLGLHQAQWTAIVMLVVVTPLVYLAWRRRLDTVRAPT